MARKVENVVIEKKVDKRTAPSPEKLEMLKLAREKAYAIRAEQRELKDKELLVKQLERERREKEVNSKLKELGKPELVVKTKTAEPKPEPIPEQKPEPEPEVIKVVKPVKNRKKIIIEESSSSEDDEPEIVFRRVKKSSSIPIPHQEKTLTEEVLSQSAINNELKRLRKEMARKSLFKAY